MIWKLAASAECVQGLPAAYRWGCAGKVEDVWHLLAHVAAAAGQVIFCDQSKTLDCLCSLAQVVAAVEAFTLFVLSRYAEHTGTSTYSSLVGGLPRRRVCFEVPTVLAALQAATQQGLISW